MKDMETVTLNIEELKSLIKDAVRDSIRAERLQITETLLPEISEKEMKEIRSFYGNKPAEQDFTDMTGLVLDET